MIGTLIKLFEEDYWERQKQVNKLLIHNVSGSVCECCGHEILLSKPKCEWCGKSWLYEKQTDR